MRLIIYGLLSFLMGDIALYLFTAIQRMMAGYPPVVLKVYLFSILFGGISGVMIGMCRLKMQYNKEKKVRLNFMYAEYYKEDTPTTF